VSEAGCGSILVEELAECCDSLHTLRAILFIAVIGLIALTASEHIRLRSVVGRLSRARRSLDTRRASVNMGANDLTKTANAFYV
jgi:hypothetical protein